MDEWYFEMTFDLTERSDNFFEIITKLSLNAVCQVTTARAFPFLTSCKLYLTVWDTAIKKVKSLKEIKELIQLYYSNNDWAIDTARMTAHFPDNNICIRDGICQKMWWNWLVRNNKRNYAKTITNGNLQKGILWRGVEADFAQVNTIRLLSQVGYPQLVFKGY